MSKKEAQIFKSLAHPARLAILDALRGGEQCVCHLESVLEMRQAYISQQLAVLKEAGVVEDRREGWNIYYFVSHPEVLTAIESIRAMPGIHATSVAGRAHKTARCPCPKCRSSEKRGLGNRKDSE